MKKNSPGCECCGSPCPATDCDGGGTLDVNKATFVVTLPDTFVFWSQLSFPSRFFKLTASGFSGFNGTYELTKDQTTCLFNAPQYAIEADAADGTLERYNVVSFCPGTVQQTYTTLTLDLTMNLSFLWFESPGCWGPSITLSATITVSENTGGYPGNGAPLFSANPCVLCVEEDLYSAYTSTEGPAGTDPCFTATIDEIWATVTPSES